MTIIIFTARLTRQAFEWVRSFGARITCKYRKLFEFFPEFVCFKCNLSVYNYYYRIEYQFKWNTNYSFDWNMTFFKIFTDAISRRDPVAAVRMIWVDIKLLRISMMLLMLSLPEYRQGGRGQEAVLGAGRERGAGRGQTCCSHSLPNHRTSSSSANHKHILLPPTFVST